jgi:acetyl esterase/lipase
MTICQKHLLFTYFKFVFLNLNFKCMIVKKLFPVSLWLLLVLASCSKTDTGGGSTPTPTPVTEKITMDVAYGTDPMQKMDIYLPTNRSITTTKVLIYVHGGAWVGGDKSDLNGAGIDSIRKRLPDYAVFNVNYRLAAFPATNPFPAQEMDIKAAVEFIYANRTTNLISDKFVMMGHSAGGHLSLLHAYKYQTPVKIKAVVDFFGPTNMATMYSDYASNPPAQFGLTALMSGTPTSNPSLYQSSSPFTYATTSNACPTIILQGGADVTVYPTQSSTLRDKLSLASVVNQYVYYPLLPHGPWDAATNTDAMNKIQPFLAANVQ